MLPDRPPRRAAGPHRRVSGSPAKRQSTTAPCSAPTAAPASRSEPPAGFFPILNTVPDKGILILICGSRNWYNRAAIQREMRRFGPLTDTIMHGAASGADTIAGNLGYSMGFNVRAYPAQWEKYGRAAGPIRNQLMLDQGPDLVLAFHENIDESKGTAHMERIAKAKGVPVEVFSA